MTIQLVHSLGRAALRCGRSLLSLTTLFFRTDSRQHRTGYRIGFDVVSGHSLAIWIVHMEEITSRRTQGTARASKVYSESGSPIGRA